MLWNKCWLDPGERAKGVEEAYTVYDITYIIKIWTSTIMNCPICSCYVPTVATRLGERIRRRYSHFINKFEIRG
jgi:hypothetical protein